MVEDSICVYVKGLSIIFFLNFVVYEILLVC